MNGKEIALRKELAVMHLRVARAELALARSQRPDALASAAPVLAAVSTALQNRKLGRWGKYLRWALRVARIVVDVRRVL